MLLSKAMIHPACSHGRPAVMPTNVAACIQSTSRCFAIQTILLLPTLSSTSQTKPCLLLRLIIGSGCCCMQNQVARLCVMQESCKQKTTCGSKENETFNTYQTIRNWSYNISSIPEMQTLKNNVLSGRACVAM